VRDDVPVTDAEQRDGRATGPDEKKSVLANLPRSRPQRSSPRRAAARAATTAGQGTAATARVRPRRQTRAAPKPAAERPAAKRPAAKRTRTTGTRARASTRRGRASGQEAAPRQGFETDGNAASGPVQPPGGAELLGSAAEILAELAKGGLSAGERLLRDALSRLPGAR
jgi:hypothetical protein